LTHRCSPLDFPAGCFFYNGSASMFFLDGYALRLDPVWRIDGFGFSGRFPLTNEKTSAINAQNRNPCGVGAFAARLANIRLHDSQPL